MQLYVVISDKEMAAIRSNLAADTARELNKMNSTQFTEIMGVLPKRVRPAKMQVQSPTTESRHGHHISKKESKKEST